MRPGGFNLSVEKLGDCRIASPISGLPFVKEGEGVLFHRKLADAENFLKAGKALPHFEMAGPREKIYFDPSKLKCGIVTCGGLCPGLNDVIRAIVMSLFYHYNVKSVFGFRFGFEGLVPSFGHTPIELNPGIVDDIHKWGGTILGTSRGPQDVSEMADTLERMNVRILFAIGGDGTLRGCSAIAEEIKKRESKIGVIGVPKTIDNDISYVDQSFGFDTAVSESRTAIYSAHTEALGIRNGVGLVKLMGRYSGFIAAYASLANNDVNFCLVPEERFSLDVFLKALQQRLQARGHAVIVVAEGAGQDLMGKYEKRDASGNLLLNDIGFFLKESIKGHFQRIHMEVNLKYIDPSYMIRSVPANARDSAYCLLLGHNAVHAGMAGRTNMLVGLWNNRYTHVPIALAAFERKKLDTESRLWSDVLSCTGQPGKLI